MALDLNTLDCILDCVLGGHNGGSLGGNSAYDDSVNRVRAGTASLDDFDRVTTIPLSYFYAESNTAFSAWRTSLWACIAGCIAADPANVPGWFDSSRTLGFLLS